MTQGILVCPSCGMNDELMDCGGMAIDTHLLSLFYCLLWPATLL